LPHLRNYTRPGKYQLKRHAKKTGWGKTLNPSEVHTVDYRLAGRVVYVRLFHVFEKPTGLLESAVDGMNRRKCRATVKPLPAAAYFFG
jgi:hypothetical protein